MIRAQHLFRVLFRSYFEENAGKDGDKDGHAENDNGSVGQRHVTKCIELAHEARRAQEGSQEEEESFVLWEWVLASVHDDGYAGQEDAGEAVRGQSHGMHVGNQLDDQGAEREEEAGSNGHPDPQMRDARPCGRLKWSRTRMRRLRQLGFRVLRLGRSLQELHHLCTVVSPGHFHQLCTTSSSHYSGVTCIGNSSYLLDRSIALNGPLAQAPTNTSFFHFIDRSFRKTRIFSRAAQWKRRKRQVGAGSHSLTKWDR